jgi:hypothetical protein
MRKAGNEECKSGLLTGLREFSTGNLTKWGDGIQSKARGLGRVARGRSRTEKEERDQLKMLNSKFKIEGCWRGGLRDGQQTRKSETRHLVSYELTGKRSLCNGRRKHMISRR